MRKLEPSSFPPASLSVCLPLTSPPAPPHHLSLILLSSFRLTRSKCSGSCCRGQGRNPVALDTRSAHKIITTGREARSDRVMTTRSSVICDRVYNLNVIRAARPEVAPSRRTITKQLCSLLGAVCRASANGRATRRSSRRIAARKGRRATRRQVYRPTKSQSRI